MALPAATGGFPAATGAFPAPTATNDPLFGVNPYTPGKSMYGVQLPEGGIPDLAARQAAQQQLLELASVQSLGVPLDSNPTEWTPAEAAQQTDQAIARIGAVNPQMAEELAARRAGQQEQDSGDSFFDNVKEVAGDVLSPALSVGGKLLDIVSRTANIVPNLAFDAVDGGDFNMGKDVAGAFTGNMRHNWNSVFQEAGWDGGGIGGVIRAGLGLVGDIATDPLTWLIPANLGKLASAPVAAERAALGSETVLNQARKLFTGESDEAIVKLLQGRWDALTKGAQAQGWKLGEDLDERILGLIGSQYKGAEKQMLGDMFTIADRTYRAAGTKSLPKLLSKGFIDLGEGRRVAGSEIKDALSQSIKAGAWKSRTGAEGAAWSQARAIASAMGGTRLKLTVPFTSLRYISPAVPGTMWLGEHSASMLSRFAAGQSGMNRMQDAIYAGKGSWQDLTNWMEGGFSHALKENPELVNGLRGRYKNLGSMFYSASEGMGRITEHLGSAARASRTGLGGYFAHAEETRIKSAYNHFIRETAYNIERQGGARADRQQILREMESRLGLSLRKKGQTATTEEKLLFAKYLDYFPTGLDSTDPAAVEAWFWNLPENAAARQRMEGAEAVEGALRPGEEEVNVLQRKLDDMQNVAATLDPGQRETLDTVSTIWEHARNEAAKKDAVLADVRMAYDEVGRLVPAQAEQWGAGAHPLLAQNDFFIDAADASKAQRLKSTGITEEVIGDHADVTGIRATRVAGGGAASEALGVSQHRVRIRGNNWLVVDETGDAAATSDEELILAAREEAEAITQGTQEAIDEAAGRPMGTGRAIGEPEKKTSQLVTAKLRAERPEASGVIYKRADGSVEVVAFNPTDVKVVDESAAVLAQERGFFHRQFSGETKEWLRGKPSYAAVTLLVAEPGVEAYLKRETAGMTLQEADDHIRRMFAAEYGEDAAATLPASIWELDALKVHEDYIEHVAGAVASEMTGKAARRFVTLGDLAPVMFGSMPRDQRYEYGISANLLKALRGKDSKVTRAIMAANAKTAKLVEAQHAETAANAERYGMFAALVETSLSDGVEVPSRFVEAARRVGRTVSDVNHKIGEEAAGLEARKVKLQQDLDTYAEIERQLAADPVVGHPGVDDDIVVRQLPGGVQEVLAWHGKVEGDIDDIQGVPGDSFSWGGMHVGSFRAGLDRVRGVIADTFEGARVGQRTAASEAPERAIGDLAHNPNEFVVRQIDPADGRVVDEHIVTGNFDAAEAERRAKAMGFEESPDDYTWHVVEQEPTHYSEDYMFPVVTRGRIYGLGPGETPPPREALHPEFVSMTDAAQRDLSNPDLITRAQLKAEGYDGIAYQNSVEDAGSTTVVMLEPGTTVSKAYGPRRLEELAEKGKLFVGPDGKYGLKRVKGSRLVRPRTQSQEGLDAVARRLRELDDIKRGIETGHDPAQGVALAPELAQDASATVGRRTPLERSLGDASEAAESLGRETAAAAERLGKQKAAATRRLAKLENATHRAATEANKAYAEFHGLKARVQPALVKVETAGDMKGLTRLHVPGLEGFAMPNYIAEEFHSIIDKHGIGHLRQSWRQYVMGPWKRWATYRWPGFHVRNFFGAFFNNFLGGVIMPDYTFAWRVTHAGDGVEKWAGRKVAANEMGAYSLDRVFGYTPTYGEVADLLAEHGVGRANTMAVMGIGESTEAAAANYRAIGKDGNVVRRAARKFDGMMRDVGSGIEDFHRVAAWGRGMASTGGDTYGARAFVMMRHGDYSDLTGAEDFIRDLVPFYKWTRTNVPYQLRMLAENPQALTMVHDKLKRSVYDAQGLNYEEAQTAQPEWMKQSLAMPIPEWVPLIGSKGKGPNQLKYAMFDLPYTDLYNGLNDYLSSTLPVVRNVLESYGFKQTLFSGTPLTGKYKPLSGVFNLPGVRDMLSAAGLARKGAKGQLFIEDKMQNVLMAWPIFSRFRNFTESDPERVDARLGGMFSLFSGVSVRTADYTQAELDFFYNEVEPLMEQYRSLGIGMPTIDDIQSGEVGSAVGLTNEPAPEGVSPLAAAVAAL